MNDEFVKNCVENKVKEGITMLSIATDYVSGQGNPTVYLKRISEAGFSHIHWCHQWNTDFIYSIHEISYIKGLLNKYSLKLLDLHASCGKEKVWDSKLEHERLAGVELVKNRIFMSSELGSDVIVMHANEYSGPLKRSLDELKSYAKERNVRIAIENIDDFKIIENIFKDYGEDYIGLCFDSGHGNLHGTKDLDDLKCFKDRLIAVHLHDNDGKSDQHKPPFSGSIDWGYITSIIAESAYGKILNLEVSIGNSGFNDELVLLDNCYKIGNKLSKMVADKKTIHDY